MKVRNSKGELKELVIKANDSIPAGSVIDFDGDVVPEGYEKVEEESWKNIENNIYYNKKDKFVNINSTNLTWNITLTGFSYTTLGKLPTDYCPSRVITQCVFIRSKTPDDESLNRCYLEIGTDGTIKIFNWGVECTTQRILFNVSYCVD